MSFKDQIKQDLSDIFLNLDEFADLHRIEGKEVPVVIDSDIMAKLSKSATTVFMEWTRPTW